MNPQQNKGRQLDIAPRSSAATKTTLEKAPIHDSWVSGFRTPENEKFFDRVLERVLHVVGAKPGERILDAGCGSGTKSMLLAARGMNVTGADFSEYVLAKARSAAEHAGLSERVVFAREDLLALSFPNDEFPYVLCWGVVMHIPDHHAALDELSRVVRPGGYLILSEGNMYSLQSLLLRGAKRLLGRQRSEIVPDDIGLEFWDETPSGRLMSRQTNILLLIKAIEGRGFRLERRFAGQFSELYMTLRSPVARKMIHALNELWFRYIRTGRLAYGNIVVLQKQRD